MTFAIARRQALFAALLLLWLNTSLPAQTATEQAPAAAAQEGINRGFLDPNLDAQEWLQRFEVESREVFAHRDQIVKALQLKQGMRVADVGSGTGLFLKPFAEAVGSEGRVYAVDISPRFIEFIRQRIETQKLGNVQAILSQEDSTKLPADAVDRVFICDTYHHFTKYRAMLDSIHAALKPGGQLVAIDFERIPGTSRQWILDHVRAGKDEVTREIEAAGFRLLEEVEVPGFQENYLLRFERS